MKASRFTARLLVIAASTVIALACIATPALAATGNADADTLRIGVPTDRCPVFYHDADTGEITGIGVDLMRYAAEEAGFTVTFKSIGTATIKEALDDDSYDVIMPFGSEIDSAAGRATVVSDSLIQTPFTPVTVGSRNAPLIEDGLEVGMLRSLGGAAETVQQLYPATKITLFDTMDDSVTALRAGKVDALLHNSYVWSYVLQKPSYADLSVQPATMFTMDFRAGAIDSPEGRAIIERLNRGIASLNETRQQAVVLDHTSRHLYRYDLSDFLYQYGVVVVLALLLIAALVVIAVQWRRTLLLKQEQKMRQLLDYDSLTGALSMSGFRRRVEELLSSHPDTPYLLSYNNIKNFKYINDSLGKESGNDLLRFWVARSMEGLSDEEAICRIEGDHFAVLRQTGGGEMMLYDGRDVFEPVRNYFVDRGKQVSVQICSGIYVLTPEDYTHVDVDRMLDCARVAERRVRDSLGDGYEFYNPDQWEKGRQIAHIIGSFPVALASGEFQVYYQPQVNYETREIIGAEALCRWKHAELGWISPSVFVPVLEESGLIYDLDCFVWDTVCQDLCRWNDQGNHRVISVNVSRSDIHDCQSIPAHFDSLIKTYGLSPDQLRIEITETAYVEDSELLIDTTKQLRELGFQVDMDDFGSGYSSLHMLKEVPVDRIKLDLHFLTETGDPHKGRIIVGYMIQMVRSLDMHLIAEGVETSEQADFLQEHGCPEMQGFYFYKPMPVEEFEKACDA